MAKTRRVKGKRVPRHRDQGARHPTAQAPNRRAQLTWLALGAIVLLGLGLRLSYLREVVASPDYTLPQIDAGYYDYWARGLATGHWEIPKNLADFADPEIRTRPYFRPPAYPYFLAAVYYVSGGSHLAARMAQMALGLVNCVLAYFLGRLIFGRGPGLIAALFMSCYWVFIFFEGELLAPVLLVTLGLSLIYVLSLWSDRLSFRRGLAGGLLLGLSALARANFLLFAPAVLVWSWWLARYRRPRCRVGPTWLGFALGAAVMIAPATIRNCVAGKDCVLISSNAGISMYTGNHEGANGRYSAIPGLRQMGLGDEWTCFDYPRLVRGVESLTGKPMKHSEVSSYFVDRSLAFMRRHPWQTVKLIAIKAALFWGPEEVPNNKPMAEEKAHSATLRYLPGFALPLSVGLFGLIQFFVGRRKRSDEHPDVMAATDRQFDIAILIVLFILVCFVSYLPFFVAGRYRVPVIPFLFLFGAYGVCRVGRLFLSARRRPAIVWLVMLAVLYGIASIPLVPPQSNEAQWHLLRASCYRLADKPELVMQECRAAVSADPENAEGHRRLADMLYRKQDMPGAIEHYAQAVALKPDYMEARYNLATSLLAEDRPDEALVHLNWMAEHYPDLPDVHYLLGRVRQAKRQIGEAAGHYRRAIELKEDYYQAHNNLANCLMGQGRTDEAIRHYRRALEIRPDYVTARRNLERALRARNGSPR